MEIKRKIIKRKLKNMYWLLDRKSKLAFEDKLTLENHFKNSMTLQ